MLAMALVPLVGELCLAIGQMRSRVGTYDDKNLKIAGC